MGGENHVFWPYLPGAIIRQCGCVSLQTWSHDALNILKIMLFKFRPEMSGTSGFKYSHNRVYKVRPSLISISETLTHAFIPFLSVHSLFDIIELVCRTYMSVCMRRTYFQKTVKINRKLNRIN